MATDGTTMIDYIIDVDHGVGTIGIYTTTVTTTISGIDIETII